MTSRWTAAYGAAILIVVGVLASLMSPAIAVTQTAEAQQGEYARMMLVLDSSGSMKEPASGGQTKIEAAHKALQKVVKGLPDDAEVGLRVFGATVFSRGDAGACSDTQKVVDLGTDNRSDLLAAISKYKPYGETPIPAALKAAASDLGAEGARSIVLVSDGESTCQPDPCVVASELAKKGIDLAIDVVGLSVSGKARRQLQCIADAGNGQYYDANSAAEIESHLTRVAVRALRPFRLDGTPISGGPMDNPTPMGAGDWVDKLGPANTPTGEKAYQVTKSAEGTTLRVSALTQGQRKDDSVSLALFDSSGRQCDSGRTMRTLPGRMVLGVQSVAGPSNDCDAPGEYTVTMKRDPAFGANEKGDFPIGLRVVEEPAIADLGPQVSSDFTVKAPGKAASVTPILAGQSFAEAPALTTGSYSSDLVPGESLLFRVPLQYGQTVQLAVRFPAGTRAQKREMAGTYPPRVAALLYNPMFAALAGPSVTDTNEANVGGDAPVEFTAGTPTINRNLIASNGFVAVNDFSMAGDYYLGVSLATQDYSALFPFRIDVLVSGEPGGAPTYVDGQEWTVASALAGGIGEAEPETTSAESASAEPSQAAETSSAPATEAEGGSRLPLVIGAVALLGALIGGFVWLRRGRAS